MKVAIAFLVFGVLFSVCARDRSPERRMPRGERRARFEQPAIPQSLLSAERGEFRGMRYRRIAMNMNGAGDPHLVLVLHGRSGSGDDNTRQLSSPAILSLVEYLRNTGTKCVVLIPQCPRNRDWLRGGADSMLDHAADLVKKEARESGISSGRTYVTGVSMGGARVTRSCRRIPDCLPEPWWQVPAVVPERHCPADASSSFTGKTTG